MRNFDIQASLHSSLNGYRQPSFFFALTFQCRLFNTAHCSLLEQGALCSLYLGRSSATLRYRSRYHRSLLQLNDSLPKNVAPIEKYFRRRTREKRRKFRLAKANGKKTPIKITSSLKKKQRNYYIMELLRRKMRLEEFPPEVVAAPQLPILFPYRPYEIIPRSSSVRSRERLFLRQKFIARVYDLQQDRLAQNNPLHSQCRTCPVCQLRFVEGQQKMLHHLFHYLPCPRSLPVETLQALIAQKEYADHIARSGRSNSKPRSSFGRHSGWGLELLREGTRSLQ